jgi:hypothetical protein
MHHPHDQAFKATMGASLELVARVVPERVVHVAPQRIDVAYEPHARAPELGVLDRMVAMGPGMFEYYARQPSPTDTRECLRKRLNYQHERTSKAARGERAAPPEPWLWILSTTRPRAAFEAHSVVLMTGWPAGFFRAGADERMCFVVLNELPEREDTLLLRLHGRGPGLPRALAELDALPATHPLRIRVWPVMVAYGSYIVEDLKRSGDMTLYQQAMAVYQEFVERIREEEQRNHNQEVQRIREEEQRSLESLRALLHRLLVRRFGAVSEDAQARIRVARQDTLERWIEQVFTARSCDDVLA